MSGSGELTIDDSFIEDEIFESRRVEHDDDDVDHNARPELNANQTRKPSDAQALVEMAAYRIDAPPSKLEYLLNIMNEELITEVWQLEYLDSANWRDMGFPIGLVASIRRLMHEKETTEITDGHPNKPPGLFTSHTFHGVPNYSNSMNSTAGKLQTSNTGSTDDDVSVTTEPETPMLSAGVGPGRTVKRISDITISERIRSSTGLLFSSPLPVSKPKMFVSRSSTKDKPPVLSTRRSSQHSPTRSPTRSTRSSSTRAKKQAMRTSMPARPLRRPTLYDNPEKLTKLDFDDLSETESFAMDSVGMLIVGSKSQGQEKTDPNSSLAVVTGSIKDLRELLDQGAESTIDEGAENESKFSDGSNNPI